MLSEKQQKRQLLRQNQQLKRQLQKSQSLVEHLYRQIEQLKSQLAHYQYTPSPKTPQTLRMTVEEHFDGSSGEEKENEVSDDEDTPTRKVKFKNQNLYQSASHGRANNVELRKTNTKIIFNSEEEVPKKSIQKLLKKSTERKKQLGSTSERDSSIKAASTKDLPSPLPIFGRDFSMVRSEKLLFKKTSNSKPIFDHFFVTGTTKDGPSITYRYPGGSGHDFSGYLALIYGENYLKAPDLSPCNSRNKINPHIIFRDSPLQPSNCKRQCFVIPIMKSKGNSAQRDYLIVCQVQESVLERPDKDLTNYTFNRSYCFLTQWKFFSEFKKLTNLLMDRMQERRKHRQPTNEVALGIQIAQQLEQSLSFLHQKSTDYNKTIDCCIGQANLRFQADVPPYQSSYQLVDRYIQNHLFSTAVYIKSSQQQVTQTIQTKLFGLLLAYGLAQVKMVLYSGSKVRVSETIIEFLQIIRPLVYVNPIILSAIREEHQTYLDAPMGLMLGLWNQHRRSNRQKIQIFMNKKLNLAGLIEKAKLVIPDGIVVNLDTGFVFGGAIDSHLNLIAQKLNNIAPIPNPISKSSRNLRDYYKMVQKLLAGRMESEDARSTWASLMKYIVKTQLHCYYLQNKEE